MERECNMSPYRYMAPEVLKEDLYTSSADLWSLGAVISFVCNNGVHWFKDRQETISWQCGQNPVPGFYSITLSQQVSNLLHPEYKMRPSAKSIVESAEAKQI